MSKNKAEDKQAQAWEFWQASLSPAARKALDEPEPPALPVSSPAASADDEEDAYAELCERLSVQAREALDQAEPAAPSSPDTIERPDQLLARPCLVESPNGDWATLRVFKTMEGLARRIGDLEGSDTVVWAVFGVPMRLTKGPQRYLLLPDGENAIMVPMYSGGPVKKVEASLLEGLEMQEDGFIGPYELANTKVVSAKLENQQPAPAKGKESSDDDDDDDDDDDN